MKITYRVAGANIEEQRICLCIADGIAEHEGGGGGGVEGRPVLPGAHSLLVCRQGHSDLLGTKHYSRRDFHATQKHQ